MKEQKKLRPKGLFLRTNYGRHFTIILIDFIIISSTRMHMSGVVQEGFTGLLLRNLYNNLYYHLILFTKN